MWRGSCVHTSRFQSPKCHHGGGDLVNGCYQPQKVVTTPVHLVHAVPLQNSCYLDLHGLILARHYSIYLRPTACRRLHTHILKSAKPFASQTCEQVKLAKVTWFLSVLQGLKHAFVYLICISSTWYCKSRLQGKCVVPRAPVLSPCLSRC